MKHKIIVTKQQLIKAGQLAGFFLLYAGLAALIYLLFYFNGYQTIDDIRQLIGTSGAIAWLVFAAVQIFTTVVLFIIPGQTTAFIFLALALFTPLQAFIIVTITTLITSTINFSIGKLMGKTVVRKIIGEEAIAKYQAKLETKAILYYPIMMLFPFFPDDELTLIAGLTKMKYAYFIPVTFITRAIGIAAYTFVGQVFDFPSFSLLDWYQALVIGSLVLAGVFYLAHRFEKYLLYHG